VSAKYGLSHLRFCLDSAGNEIAALAMYNAGTNKVRNNSTPQMTLNYISKIENYRSWLEDNFSTEVLAFYEIENDNNKLLAKK
ncbi:MAG: lytic transglycosylase, partial [Treponema sp.]